MSGLDFDEIVKQSPESATSIDYSYLDASARRSPADRPAEPETDAEQKDDDRPENEPGEAAEPSRSAGSTGGTGSSPAPAHPGEATAPEDVEVAPVPEVSRPEVEPSADEAREAPQTPAVDEPVKASSLDHTDQQDAIQEAAAASSGATGRRGGSGGDVLPMTPGFSQAGVPRSRQVKVSGLPSEFVGRLRAVLEDAAAREPGVDSSLAREFAEVPGQAGLVMAFLAAQLDLNLVADATTMKAVELFRRRDPLLGSVVDRLEALEQSEREGTDLLRRLREGLRSMSRQVDATEMEMAWLAVDRVSKVATAGVYGAEAVDLQHAEAVKMRTAARTAAAAQRRIEEQHEGRRFA